MVEEALSFWTEIQRFEDMLAADPRSLSFAPLAELYRKLGLLDDAISVAKKGCQQHPDYPGGFFALGTACLDKGLKAEARSALERVVLLNPENLRAQKLLGQLYAETGENALAERALRQVLEQNPDDAESSLLLRSIAPEVGEEHGEEEIIEDLIEVLEEEPEFELDSWEQQVDPRQVAAPVVSKIFPSLDAPEVAAVAEPHELLEAFEAPEVPGDLDVPEVPEVLEVPEILEGAEGFEVAEAPEAPAEPAALLSRNPLTTATLAELYVSQGFLERAIVIYQELLAVDPENHAYRLRLAELRTVQERQKVESSSPHPVAPTAQAETAVPKSSVDAELYRWLENIRRRRDGV